MNNITKALFSEYIKGFKLQELFNYLGWNNDRTQVPPFKVNDVVYKPKIIGDKNGFKIIECGSDTVPLYNVRAQILNILRTKFAELMIIFTDSAKSRQVWRYGYKHGTQNKRAECEYRSGQDPQALYERAAGLFFSLDEEDNITIVDVTARVRSNFTQNAERVTKRFYDEFKRQHTALLGFITGVTQSVDKEWYASIMLNRLMFCYFMQRRGFLDNNRNYLRQKLNESKQKLGKGKFYSFYRSFLLTLFQRGFGTYHHTPEIKAMIGDIPYLNGGLFDLHEIEKSYPNIDISDEAFEHIFDLFDRYEWHLDTRAAATGNEINPDVLGYIFEKYINDRAAMGAYYTQEDITGYISRSTILPYLLEATKKAYGKPFEQGGTVWRYLQESGDRYIFESVKKGANEPLPDNIAIGIDTTAPNLLERRKDWNKPVPDGIGLPTEIWREFIERTSRYRSVLANITGGAIADIADFITYNLDIISFAGDLLDTIEDPKFIQVFYSQLEKVTILDPTCGSGAFLFAALNILEPLYDSCLSRMEDYLSHDYKGILERSIKRYFDEKLEQMESEIHPNKHYFIYKSIILNNLYGVDIMKEAVETAKLRLFLKLVSTAEPNYRADNIGIEPLPDIDFNIKAGNTLIGFANEQEVQDALNGNLIGMTKIGETMDAMLQMSKAVSRYKQLQLGEGDYSADEFKAEKAKLSERQAELRGKLDKLLRDNEYGESVSDDAWRNNYQPFHWVSEFYSTIVENGGFDVVIGNPPYVEYSKVKHQYTLKGYKTLSCGNLYAFVIERSCNILHLNSLYGMIVPLSLSCSERMIELRDAIRNSLSTLHISNYEIFPSKLFDGAFQRLSIFVGKVSENGNSYRTTKLNRWYSAERGVLIERQKFCREITAETLALLGKYESDKHLDIVNRMSQSKIQIARLCDRTSDAFIYYQEATNYWMKATMRIPFYKKNGIESVPDHGRILRFPSENNRNAILVLLSSSLFYLWYSTYSDGFHLSDMLVKSFPVIQTMLADNRIQVLARRLEEDVEYNSILTTRNTATDNIEIESFRMVLSKPIIDEIDIILAKHYGFTEEEMDYIINYDIKYRMGLGGGDDDDE